MSDGVWFWFDSKCSSTLLTKYAAFLCFSSVLIKGLFERSLVINVPTGQTRTWHLLTADSCVCSTVCIQRLDWHRGATCSHLFAFHQQPFWLTGGGLREFTWLSTLTYSASVQGERNGPNPIRERKGVLSLCLVFISPTTGPSATIVVSLNKDQAYVRNERGVQRVNSITLNDKDWTSLPQFE